VGLGQAVACPVVILPQGSADAPGSRVAVGGRVRDVQRTFEGSTRRLRRSSDGNQVFHVPAAGWSSVWVCGGGGFEAADGLGAGAGEGAVGAIGESHGDGVLGDVDGDDGVGLGASEGEFLAGDHDDSGG
jgi:hypothetical protein